MSQVVVAKTTLHRGPNDKGLPRKEIRRFQYQSDISKSYEIFREKIVALYPDLDEAKEFRLFWVDEEGDEICFSSNDEFGQAILHVTNENLKVLKVSIRFPPKPKALVIPAPEEIFSKKRIEKINQKIEQKLKDGKKNEKSDANMSDDVTSDSDDGEKIQK